MLTPQIDVARALDVERRRPGRHLDEAALLFDFDDRDLDLPEEPPEGVQAAA